MRVAVHRLTDLSLDAPIVGCLWLGLFSTAYGLNISYSIYLLLFICIACVYIWDRLSQSRDEIREARHVFHLKYLRGFMIALLIAVALMIIILLLFPISRSYYESGLLVLIPTLVYMLLSPKLNHLPLLKHALASILFVAGTTIPIWGVYQVIDFQGTLELLSLCIAAWLNMLQIDVREHPEAFNVPNVIVYLLIILSLVAAFWLSSWIIVAAAVSLGLLKVLYVYAHHIDVRNYRTLADIALMIPAGIGILLLTLL